MDMKYVELMESARIIVEDCVNLKEGNEALVVTDSRAADYCGVEALLHAVIGAQKPLERSQWLFHILPKSPMEMNFPRQWLKP